MLERFGGQKYELCQFVGTLGGLGASSNTHNVHYTLLTSCTVPTTLY